VAGWSLVEALPALASGWLVAVALARVYLSPRPGGPARRGYRPPRPAAEARAEEAFSRRPGTLVVVAHRISSTLYTDLVGYWEGAGPPAPASPASRAGAASPSAAGRAGEPAP
jgi:hypothetical protein